MPYGIEDDLIEENKQLKARVAELEAQLNKPEIIDFAKAVALEAAHQRSRWGSAHDAGKTDADWFWLIGYLSGKALHNPWPETSECGCPTNTQLLQALGVSVPPEMAASADGMATGHLKKCLAEKKLHRIVTVAAAAANWHAAILGLTDMRPGIEPPR